jgi:pimeloyl-ACP methyl ester carboxylesterase
MIRPLTALFATFATFALLFSAAVFAKAPKLPSSPPRILVTVEGHGPDVIFIPGLSSSPQVWEKAILSLKGKYRVHRVQLSGFGGAPAADKVSGPILDGVVGELDTYVRKNKLKKPAFVGHSMGGLLSLMLALRHPEDVGKVMIVDSLPFIGLIYGAKDVADVTETSAAMRDQIAAMSAKDYAASQDRSLLSLVKSDADRPWLAKMSSASDPKTVAQVFYEVMTTDVRPTLPTLRVPITVLYPTNAYLTAERAKPLYEGAYAGAKSARLIAVPDSYHFIMQDQPTMFATLLGTFLTNK